MPNTNIGRELLSGIVDRLVPKEVNIEVSVQKNRAPAQDTGTPDSDAAGNATKKVNVHVQCDDRNLNIKTNT